MPRDAVDRLLARLGERSRSAARPLHDWLMAPAGAREDAVPRFARGSRRCRLPLRFRADRPVWFRHELRLAEHERGRPLWLLLDVDEALLFVEGRPFQGIDANHREALLPSALTRRNRLTLTLQVGRRFASGPAGFRSAELALADEAARALHDRLAALVELRDQLASSSAGRRVAARLARLAARLEAGLDGSNGSATRAMAQALRELDGPAVSEALAQVHLVGHSHLDVVWLWTLAETRRKCARTFATALRLMERFPEYRFTQSQAQLYEWLREDQPRLFAEVRARVREGRWLPLGATWVEPDCNIPSGEALARQVIHGQRYFRETFGRSGDVLWLPDTFGYAWSLPQILRQAGVRRFFTTKLLWNDSTRFPHRSFVWEGIDGSRVLAHNPPVGLEGMVRPQHLLQSWRGHRERRVSGVVLQTFGYGDGGGGPTAAHLEAARALGCAPGLPRSRISDPLAFFRRLERDVDNLPVWRDELYLEMHRGTYTTHAWLKQANRRAEAQLYTTELLWAQVLVIAPAARAVRRARAQLESLLKLLLTNQFHDIVPGTAIAEAYHDVRRDFAAIDGGCRALQREALDLLLAPERPAPPRRESSRAERSFTVFNPLPWERELWLVLRPGPGFWRATDGDGCEVPTQRVFEDGASAVLCSLRVPACGTGQVRFLRARAEPQGMLADAHEDPAARATPGPENVAVRLESDAVRLDVDDRGRIASFFDKRAGRELVAAGESIGLQAFRDEPRHWEAWDIDPAYETKPLELFDRGSVEVLERGPLRWRARVELRAASGTRVVEELLLHRAEPRVDVRMKLVWRERRTLLKAAFPLSLRASRATYEIPFGAIERPTASDAPRERARFEVPGQQWADISARGYGVSLLNDCKYGYDCRGSRLRLTLLRSPRYPHPVEPMTKADRRVTDQGRHELAYALLAHRGTWREAGTVRRAREMNTPPIVIDGDRRLRVPAFLRLDSDHVQLAAVKPADAGAGIVLRLVEAHGRAGTASVRLGFDVGEARQTDLLEDDGRRLAARGRWLRLRFRPFEIRTVRLVPRARGVPRKGRRS